MKISSIAIPAFILSLASTVDAQVYTTSYWTGNTREGTSGWGNSSTVANWSAGAVPDVNTDIIFDTAQLTGLALKSINANNLNSHNLTLSYSGSQLRLGGTVNITGDLLYNAVGTAVLLSNGSNSGSATINIAGNMVVGIQGDTTSNYYTFKMGESTSNQWGGWGGPKNLKIGGDVILYERGVIYFNVNLADRVADYSNPDIDIAGVVNFAGNGTINPSIRIINAENRYNSNGTYISSTPVQVVFASNGLKGNGVISNNSNGSIDNGLGKAIILLRNDATQTFTGWIQDGANATTKIVMNGTGTQRLTSTNNTATQGLAFTGGVEMISGTLEMSYANQLNHGNLEMKGGKFMNNPTASAKNINFTNIIYDGGTIVSRWNGTALDIITLSQGIQKGTNFGAGDKFLFEIVATDVSAIIDEKIVSWDNDTYATTFSESDFSATHYSGYDASFEIKNDGLYLSYIAVPEPALAAGIFGAIAIGLAMLRRKMA